MIFAIILCYAHITSTEPKQERHSAERRGDETRWDASEWVSERASESVLHIKTRDERMNGMMTGWDVNDDLNSPLVILWASHVVLLCTFHTNTNRNKGYINRIGKDRHVVPGEEAQQLDSSASFFLCHFGFFYLSNKTVEKDFNHQGVSFVLSHYLFFPQLMYVYYMFDRVMCCERSDWQTMWMRRNLGVENVDNVNWNRFQAPSGANGNGRIQKGGR